MVSTIFLPSEAGEVARRAGGVRGINTAAHDPLWLENLADYANGRLLEQPPVVGREPVDPKGEA